MGGYYEGFQKGSWREEDDDFDFGGVLQGVITGGLLGLATGGLGAALGVGQFAGMTALSGATTGAKAGLVQGGVGGLAAELLGGSPVAGAAGSVTLASLGQAASETRQTQAAGQNQQTVEQRLQALMPPEPPAQAPASSGTTGSQAMGTPSFIQQIYSRTGQFGGGDRY